MSRDCLVKLREGSYTTGVLGTNEAPDQRDGWLIEFMWRPVEHLRIGVGYNFTDFTDDEFSTNDFEVKGWFFRVQGTY